MKVAYLIGRYPAISHTFILREVQALRALGAEVDTFSIWRTARSELLAPVDHEEDARTTAVMPLKPTALFEGLMLLARRPRACATMVRQARRLSRAGVRGHLLAASWVLEAAIISRACRQRGIRHIHVHLGGTGTAVALLVAAFGNADRIAGAWTWSFTVHGPAEFYDVVRERLALKVRQATFVIAIGDFARSQLMALVDEGEWDKIHVVHCGVDPRVFAPVDSAEPDEDGPLRVLSVGRLTRMKGQAILLGALRLLRDRGIDVQATLVGAGPKRADLEEIADAAGLDGALTFTGAVGQDVIRRHLAEADVFCLSSFAEGVPVVLMEAMAMGRPVVAPRIMGISELVVEGETGLLVTPGRPDQLADALAALAADPELRWRLAEAGRQKVLDEFDVTTEARRVLRLLDLYTA